MWTGQAPCPQEHTLKIAIIGAGNVGSTLARRWAALGHEVTIGSQNPTSEKARALAQTLSLPVTSTTAAAAASDLILLATPADATLSAAQSCGDLSGKILMDATNPLNATLTGLDHPNGESGAQRLQQILPSTHIVKAFNTVGFNIMANPVLEGRKAVLVLSGNDAEAVSTVAKLAQETGFEPLRLGDISTSRMQEEQALLWIHLAVRGGLGRNFAFTLVNSA